MFGPFTPGTGVLPLGLSTLCTYGCDVSVRSLPRNLPSSGHRASGDSREHVCTPHVSVLCGGPFRDRGGVRSLVRASGGTTASGSGRGFLLVFTFTGYNRPSREDGSGPNEKT